VLKWISCESILQICTIICGNCHYIRYVSNCDVAIYMTSFSCESDDYVKLNWTNECHISMLNTGVIVELLEY